MANENNAVLATWLNEPKEPAFIPPKAPYPWRRYFARSLDFSLIAFCYESLLCLLLHINFAERSVPLELIDAYLCWGLTFLLEPLFLSKWGKTPGKWLFGLSIHNKNGELLTFREAFERTFQVFCQGEGFAIPFYNFYRYYKCYGICTKDGIMEWDENLCYEAKPFHPASVFGYLGIIAVSAALSVSIAFWQMNPPNNSMLTVNEFIENYNYQLDYNKIEGVMRLEEDRTWMTSYETFDGTNVINLNWFDGQISEPAFTEKDGKLSSISFTLESTEENTLISNPSEKTWLAGALLRTQIGPFYPEIARLEGAVIESESPVSHPYTIDSVIEYIEDVPFDSYVIETGNIRITQKTDISNYQGTSDYMFPDKVNGPSHFSMTFTLEQLPK
ncbi:RDD family protein [Anaerotignum sp.]